MALSEPRQIEIQSDHQHWLREIERWESCLDIWKSEQRLLVDELARLQQVIRNHAENLEKHEIGLQAVKQAIVSAERQMIERPGSGSSPSVIEAHSKTGTDHAAQRDLHERVKRLHHTLLTQLSMCKPEPFRET